MGDAWFQVCSNAKVGTASRVGKLGTVDQFADRETGCHPHGSLPADFSAHDTAATYGIGIGTSLGTPLAILERRWRLGGFTVGIGTETQSY